MYGFKFNVWVCINGGIYYIDFIIVWFVLSRVVVFCSLVLKYCLLLCGGEGGEMIFKYLRVSVYCY